jgi:hypothetical protein
MERHSVGWWPPVAPDGGCEILRCWSWLVLRRLYDQDETSDVATHVEACGDVLSDGGAIPPGSTILLPDITRRAGPSFGSAAPTLPRRAYHDRVPRATVRVAILLLAAGLSGSSSRPVAAPRLTLWAWERPEDLRFLAEQDVRVAVLDRTITLHEGRTTVQLRHQPLRVGPGTRVIPVVRVESRGDAPDPQAAPAVALEIAAAAGLPAADSVQIDFDARRSDRPFYAALIREVRRRLPSTTRLSITALASWCEDDPWVDTRQVDEMVPMLFQMGGDARRIVTRLQEDGRFPVDACNGTLGLSTDEHWRGLPPANDVYLFHRRAWRAEDLSAWRAHGTD